MEAAGQVRVGTSGWIYKHWRGVFYPERLPLKGWFAYYAGHFDTVEINNTFYRLPSPEAFDEWRGQAPAGFVYAVKASRFLTHMKKLKDPVQPLERILGRTRRLGRALGPVLYQLPPRWHCDLERLRQFVGLLPHDLSHVFEFRDGSWYNGGVREVLAAAGVGFCIHDMKGQVCPEWATGRVVYVRFHGRTDLKYAGSYGRRHLTAWADKIEAFRSGGHDVFVYFNNDDRGYALANAETLKELLGLAPVAAVR